MLLQLPFSWPSHIARKGLRAHGEANHSKCTRMVCDVRPYVSVSEQLNDESTTLFDIERGLRQATSRMTKTPTKATTTKASAIAPMHHAPAQQQGASAKNDPWRRLPKTEGCLRPRPAAAVCACAASTAASLPAAAPLTAAPSACDADPCELQARHALEYQRSQGNWEPLSSEGHGYISLSAGWQPPPGARHLPGHAALLRTLSRAVAAKAANRNAVALSPTAAAPTMSAAATLPAKQSALRRRAAGQSTTASTAACSAATCSPAPAPLTAALPARDDAELQAHHALEYQRSQGNWELLGHGYISLSAGWQPAPGARYRPGHAALLRTLSRVVAAKAANRNAVALSPTAAAPTTMSAAATLPDEPTTVPATTPCAADVEAQQPRQGASAPSPAPLPASPPPPTSIPDADAADPDAAPASVTTSSSSPAFPSRASSSAGSCASSSSPPPSSSSSPPASPSSVLRRLLFDLPQLAPTTCTSAVQGGTGGTPAVQALLMTA